MTERCAYASGCRNEGYYPRDLVLFLFSCKFCRRRPFFYHNIWQARNKPSLLLVARSDDILPGFRATKGLKSSCLEQRASSCGMPRLFISPKRPCRVSGAIWTPYQQYRCSIFSSGTLRVCCDMMIEGGTGGGQIFHAIKISSFAELVLLFSPELLMRDFRDSYNRL